MRQIPPQPPANLASAQTTDEHTSSPLSIWISRNAVGAVGITLLLVFVSTAIFLYLLSVGSFSMNSGSVKIIVAALSLFATAMTALVSLVGLLLKHSIDARSEAARIADAARTNAAAKDAEDRLKLDSAIRAVQLFANNAGEPSLQIQQSGALFALCSLRQYELTLALLEGLLAQQKVDSSTFARVLNTILMTSDESLQASAISVLSGYADRLISDLNFDLPDCFLSGCAGRSAYVRDWAPTVMVRVILARKRWEWRTRSAVNAVTMAIALLWKGEPEERIKTDAGAILGALLKVFYPKPVTLYGFHENFETDVLAADVAGSKPTSAETRRLIERLDAWSKEVEGPPAIVPPAVPDKGALWID